MKTLPDLITDQPQATDAEIATVYNAQAERYHRVESNAFLAWLGGN